MKNLLFLLISILTFSFVPIASQAQLRTMTISAADDTLTNAATGYATLTQNGSKAVVSFQLNVTKISGTVAGTATLEGSLDGTNFAQVSSSSYTITNVASQSYIWVLQPSNAIYYRIKWVGSGTQSAIPTAYALVR